jgi:glycosyltransferase involved in cell wall biosynthesis
MFVRNGARSVRRAVDSVLAQTYPNIEFVVQDGASTDGTLDILRSYGERIKLRSEPDSSPTEAFWRAILRCTGDVVGSCLADEELLPDAVERAVRAFQAEPDVGATTGDALVTDIDGNITGSWTSGPFNLVDYLTVDYSPYLVSSFFRLSALKDIGLTTRSWSPIAVKFDLWCRLATTTRIKYLPGAFAKYASHPGQMSSTSGNVLEHVHGRMERITSLCAPGGFFGDKPLLRAMFIWGHARAFCNHAVNIGKPEMAREEYRIMIEALAAQPPVQLDGLPYDADFDFRRAALAAWQRTGRKLPGATEGEFVDRLVKRRYRGDGAWSGVLKALWFAGPPQEASEIRTPSPPNRMLKARLYVEMAQSYERAGLRVQALESWRAAAITAGIYIPDDKLLRLDRKQGWADAKPQ